MKLFSLVLIQVNGRTLKVHYVIIHPNIEFSLLYLDFVCMIRSVCILFPPFVFHLRITSGKVFRFDLRIRAGSVFSRVRRASVRMVACSASSRLFPSLFRIRQYSSGFSGEINRYSSQNRRQILSGFCKQSCLSLWDSFFFFASETLN